MIPFLFQQAKVTLHQWIRSNKDAHFWSPSLQTLEYLLRPHLEAGDEEVGEIYVLFAIMHVPCFSFQEAMTFFQGHPNCDPLDTAIGFDLFTQDELDDIAKQQMDLILHFKYLDRQKHFPTSEWKDGFLVSGDILLAVEPKGPVLFVPDSIRRIERHALDSYPNLKTLSLSAEMEYSGFFGMLTKHEMLSTIEVREGNKKAFSSFDGVLYNRDQTSLLYCPRNHNPSVLVASNTTTIDIDAFSNCRNIEKIVFPMGLQDIFWGAFLGCSSLAEIVFPSSLTSVFDDAFNFCPNLRTVTFLGGAVDLDEDVFDRRDITIVAPRNSAVEAYALAQGLSFKALDEDENDI